MRLGLASRHGTQHRPVGGQARPPEPQQRSHRRHHQWSAPDLRRTRRSLQPGRQRPRRRRARTRRPGRHLVDERSGVRRDLLRRRKGRRRDRRTQLASRRRRIVVHPHRLGCLHARVRHCVQRGGGRTPVTRHRWHQGHPLDPRRRRRRSPRLRRRLRGHDQRLVLGADRQHRRRRRPSLHHVHLGHHRPAQGGECTATTPPCGAA